MTWVAVAPVWLILSRKRIDGSMVAAGVALLLYWDPPGLLRVFGADTLNVLQAVAWLLTWVGLLAIMRDGNQGQEELHGAT